MHRKISELRSAVADVVRKTAKDQVDIWRLIPGLALKADGNGGYSQRYRMAYEYGYWDLDGRLSMFVDLLTGEIVCGFGVLGGNMPKPAPDERLVDISELSELLDAKAIVASLKKEASQVPKFGRTRKDLSEWRGGVRRGLNGLGRVYVAKNRRNYPRYDVIF